MEMRFPSEKTFFLLAFLASAFMQGQSEAFQEGNLKCLKNFRAIDKTVCSLVIFSCNCGDNKAVIKIAVAHSDARLPYLHPFWQSYRTVMRRWPFVTCFRDTLAGCASNLKEEICW